MPSSDPTPQALAGYTLGVTESERDRLRGLSGFLRPAAELLLDRIGVEPGWRSVDVACGPFGILDLLADRSRPTDVTGLEREPRFLVAARQSLDELGLAEVGLVEADALATGLPADAFDLAHARLLLCNLTRPVEVLAEMARIVRPGGYVACQDIDASGWTCEPAHPDWAWLISLLGRFAGGDTRIGGRIAGLCAEVGLVDVQVEVRDVLVPLGHPAREDLPYFVELHREPILASGAAAAAELDRALDSVREHLADPITRVHFPRLYQVWGRKP